VAAGAAGPGEGVHAAAHEGGEVEGVHREHDLARHDAAHVEQIVHEALEVLRLAHDDAARARFHLVGLPDAVEDPDGVGDGAEGIAQLVAQHGEELVLGAVGRLGVGTRAALAVEKATALLLVAVALRHVPDHAGHAHGGPRLVVHEAAQALDPRHVVRPAHHAVLHAIEGAARLRRANGAQDALTIVGMDALPPGLDGDLATSRMAARLTGAGAVPATTASAVVASAVRGRVRRRA
jgi:hypothetical protein